MYETKICDALRARRLLRFWYKDHATPTVVEPYTFGEFPNRHGMLSAWLVSGETKDPVPPLWRLYREDEIDRLEILPESFANNRDGYNPNDSRFQFIRCRLASPRPA